VPGFESKIVQLIIIIIIIIIHRDVMANKTDIIIEKN